jgi:molybdopterin/thiamine biosynthesis adenylyltransferase
MSHRFSRNEGLFGAEGQALIAGAKVAIIGLGGLGSHVAQQLAYLGTQDFSLVDFDVVTESSLNRLVGATDADVAAETKKIVVGERMVRAVSPNAIVERVDGKVIDAATEGAVARANVVFGCLDRDIHRLELNELCSRFAKDYFDLATDTSGGEEEAVIYGGRVVFCDGSRCLVCLPEVLDQAQIAVDRMNPEMRDADRRIYGVDRDALATAGPSVVSINGVVASLSVTEFMVHVTGLRPAASQLTYRADRSIVRASVDQPNADCYYCSQLWGTALREE